MVEGEGDETMILERGGTMRTPRQKYDNDPRYHNMVDTLEKMLHEAYFTPSEVREMAMLACINFEFRKPRRYFIPVERAIEVMERRSGQEEGGMEVKPCRL